MNRLRTNQGLAPASNYHWFFFDGVALTSFSSKKLRNTWTELPSGPPTEHTQLGCQSDWVTVGKKHSSKTLPK